MDELTPIIACVSAAFESDMWCALFQRFVTPGCVAEQVIDAAQVLSIPAWWCIARRV